MKYKIDKFVLNERARTLSGHGKTSNIRPKTQALLIYLAKNKGQILSKQSLLDAIWHDVTVDDGVIFQSVREIRQLFDDPHIIQNHPRQGYEFTGSFEAITNRSLSTRAIWFPAILIAIAFSALLSFQLFSPKEHNVSEIGYEYGILVLPVKNRVHYGQHDWVYLGAMEQLIGKLKGLEADIYVHDGGYTLRLMQQLDLPKEFTSEDIARQFSAMGNTLVIEAEVHGNTSDYKLIYKLHRENSVQQGAILSSSVDESLASLTQLIATEFNSSLQQSSYIPTQEFNDALFAQAMISYEQDWETSISFFESYLALQPDSVVAKIYLSKLYLWQKQPEKASNLIETITNTTELNPTVLAQTNLIKGRIAKEKADFKAAQQYLKAAEDGLRDSFNWFLKASIAEEQGHAWLAENDLAKSYEAYLNALGYFRIVNSPIGIYSANLHLANVEFKQGKMAKAESRLIKTKKAIYDIELEFLYSMLSDYELKIMAATRGD